jgi:hypothetical protein
MKALIELHFQHEVRKVRKNSPDHKVTSNKKMKICKQCNCEAVEDEEHLLIKCNKYSFARNTFFSNINKKKISELSDRNKFIWLLSNEDREICKNLANFIATCLSIRDLSDK